MTWNWGFKRKDKIIPWLSVAPSTSVQQQDFPSPAKSNPLLFQLSNGSQTPLSEEKREMLPPRTQINGHPQSAPASPRWSLQGNDPLSLSQAPSCSRGWKEETTIGKHKTKKVVLYPKTNKCSLSFNWDISLLAPTKKSSKHSDWRKSQKENKGKIPHF